MPNDQQTQTTASSSTEERDSNSQDMPKDQQTQTTADPYTPTTASSSNKRRRFIFPLFGAGTPGYNGPEYVVTFSDEMGERSHQFYKNDTPCDSEGYPIDSEDNSTSR